MMTYFDKVLAFLWQVFSFGVPYEKIYLAIYQNLGFEFPINPTITEYILILISLWIALIVFTWLILWCVFKVWKVVFC